MIDNLQIVDFNADAFNITQVRIRRSDDTIQTFNTEVPGFISTNITANGTYYAPENTGFDTVTVDVPITGTMEIVNVDLNQDAQHITPSSGFDAIQEVNIPSTRLVEIQEPIMPTTQVYKASDYGAYGISQVTVEGFSSKAIDVTTEDLDDAGISLGVEKTITPKMVFPNQDLVGFKSFQLPSAVLQNKTVTPTASEQTITADPFYYGLGQVTVESAMTDLQEKTAVQNGIVRPDDGYLALSQVTVALPMQEKTITSNGTFTPDTGYQGFSSVTANIQPTGNIKLRWAEMTTNESSYNTGYATFFTDDGYGYEVTDIDSYLTALQPNEEIYGFFVGDRWLILCGMDMDILRDTLDISFDAPSLRYRGRADVVYNDTVNKEIKLTIDSAFPYPEQNITAIINYADVSEQDTYVQSTSYILSLRQALQD